MKILIIDNEDNIRYLLKQLLQDILEEDNAVFEANGVATGIAAIATIKPDIVFLDIEMDDGTGFDLLQQLSQINFQLIITTAHNKYAIDAFKVSAIDYLLKPIATADLLNSLVKAKAQISQNSLQQQVKILLNQLTQNTNIEKKIVLKDVESTYFVNVKNILYCQAQGTYTKFYFNNNSPVLVSKNLKEYESILEPMGFIRTHHSYLINPTMVKAFDKKSTGNLILEDGSTIPVSQRKKEYVLHTLESIM